MRILPVALLALILSCFSVNLSATSDIERLSANKTSLVEVPVLNRQNRSDVGASGASDGDDTITSRVRRKLALWTTRSENSARHPENKRVVADSSFYAVMIPIGVVMIVSMCGSLTVLYLGIVRHKQTSNMGQKFPLFYAVVDFLFCLTTFVNLIYLLARKTFPQQDVCAAIGAIVHFLTGVQFMQVLGLAIYVYAAVMRHQIMSFGRWEWKWLVFCAMIAAGPVLIVLPLQGFGPMRYWCQVDMDSASGYWNMVLLAIVYIFILLTITYCYVSVIWEMRSIRKNIRRLLAGITLFKHVDETPDFIDINVVSRNHTNRPGSSRLSKTRSFLWPRLSRARFSLFLPDSQSDTSSPRSSPRPTSQISPRPPQLRPQTVVLQDSRAIGNISVVPSRPTSSPSPPLLHPQPIRSISPTSLLSTTSTLASNTPRSSSSSFSHPTQTLNPHQLLAPNCSSIPTHATSYATSKLLLYIFMFIMQYLPIIILIITLLFKKDTQKVSSVVFGLGAGFACAGGILNLAVYTWNLNRRKV